MKVLWSLNILCQILGYYETNGTTLKTNVEHCDYFVIIFLAGLALKHAVFCLRFFFISSNFSVFQRVFLIVCSGPEWRGSSDG